METKKPKQKKKRSPEALARRRKRVQEALARRCEKAEREAKSSANPYWTQEILMASPLECVVRLYDGAIGFLRKASEAIEQNDPAARYQANNRARQIIEHLDRTLDMERGGEIAASLDSIYAVCLRRMVDIDVNNDPKAAADVIGLLQPMRESWHELKERVGAESAAQSGLPNTDEPSPDAPKDGTPRIYASV
ncbi:MAG: flagellar export chaperone FliS [Alphaproteobacteria bacterium]